MDLNTFIEEHKNQSFLSKEESILYYELMIKKCDEIGDKELADKYRCIKIMLEKNQDDNFGDSLIDSVKLR